MRQPYECIEYHHTAKGDKGEEKGEEQFIYISIISNILKE